MTLLGQQSREGSASVYHRVPADLTELDQWVVYRIEQRDGDPKPTKVPYQARDPKRKASSTDPKTWGSFEAALKAAELADGIGFVFSPDDEFCGADFDACVTDGKIHPHVGACLLTLNSYTEFSPSKTGVHTIVRGRVNGGRKVTGDTPWGGKFENYSEARFFTTTGDIVPGSELYVQERQAELDEVRAELLPEPEPVARPRATAVVGVDDQDLLERARKAKNGADFDRLYAGDLSAHNGDHSSADLALCGHLAFWCGIDPNRVDHLFRSSGLMRDKWDENRGETTYGQMTIEKSLRSRTEFYDWTKTRTNGSTPKTTQRDGDNTGGSAPPDVDGGELLEDIRGFITRHVVLPSAFVADLLALWVLHTWCLDAATYTPYLHICSPVKRAGKTRLLEVLELVCRNALTAGSITAAAVFQTIEHMRPTLLIDEVDRVFKVKGSEHTENLVGVLNDGFRVRGKAIRGTQGGEPKTFSTWCPKALAGIENSSLPDTVADRCIVVSLERKLKSDRVERLRGVDAEAKGLRTRCEAFAHHHGDALRAYHLPTIEQISDRAEDIWEPMFAIATEAGDDWAARARAACLELAGEESGEGSDEITLLSDIRAAFGDGKTISTESLLEALNGSDESPWGARRSGLGLDARGLAKLLRAFKTGDGVRIKPKPVRVGEHTPRGYHVDQFGDAFSRYLPDAQQAQQGQHRRAVGDGDVAGVADVADTAL